MRICIPTMGGKGLEETVSAHFGSAPYFTLVDLDSGAVEAVANANQHHSHGQCQPMSSIAGRGVNAVVTGGMGRRAIERLSAGGVKVYRAEGGTVREIVERFKTGQVNELSPGQACAGHDGGHGHGHGCR
ncbi:MAG: NifB/NifX family molybdenum-iron cluster-binding protein [Bacteroidota bacterium]